MPKPLWIFSILLLTLFLTKNPLLLTTLTGDHPTISQYECIDADGDEACDDPPED